MTPQIELRLIWAGALLGCLLTWWGIIAVIMEITQ